MNTLMIRLRESRVVTLAAIIHYRLRGQSAPCRHCLIELMPCGTDPRFQWHTCDRCDWGNE